MIWKMTEWGGIWVNERVNEQISWRMSKQKGEWASQWVNEHRPHHHHKTYDFFPASAASYGTLYLTCSLQVFPSNFNPLHSWLKNPVCQKVSVRSSLGKKSRCRTSLQFLFLFFPSSVSSEWRSSSMIESALPLKSVYLAPNHSTVTMGRVTMEKVLNNGRSQCTEYLASTKHNHIPL